MKILFASMIGLLFIGCGEAKKTGPDPHKDTVGHQVSSPDTSVVNENKEELSVAPGIVQPLIVPDSFVAFARTLQGIPYCYASIDPEKGFDCSGFITYTFNHFGMTVPRSSVEFTNYGREIKLNEAMPGDLILFTGTDSTIRVVGHMGIIESIRNGTIYFIHSTSGKNGLGVVITPLEKYYMSRFVKVIRVFRDEYFE